MPFFRRRLLETAAITLISSVPVYAVYKMGLINSTVGMYFLSFSVSALIFLIFSAVFSYIYAMSVLDMKVYWKTGAVLLAIEVAVCALFMKFASNEIYTMVYGFTKPLRVVSIMGVGFGKIKAAAVIWGLHAIMTAIVGLLVTRKVKAAKEKMLENGVDLSMDRSETGIEMDSEIAEELKRELELEYEQEQQNMR